MTIDSLENKQLILEKFLDNIAFEGVGEEVLEKSILESNLKPEHKELIFEEGVLSALEFYFNQIIQNLAQKIESHQNFSDLKIRQKIKFSVLEIFKYQTDHKLATSRILSFYFDIKNFTKSNYGPKPFSLAFKNLYRFSDQIWYLIGDKSTDYNFYTKRLVLSKLIAKSSKIFVDDVTTDLQKTSQAIDNEIENIMKFEKAKSQIKQNVENLSELSCQLKENICDIFCDKENNLKTPKNIIKSLPFIRLFY